MNNFPRGEGEDNENEILHNFIRQMTAQIKLVKTKNKQTNC